MAPVCSVFIATSLDGYIARPDGDLDWLAGHENGATSEDYGYREFMESIDAVIMGRNTFDKVMSFEKWPYSKKVVVLSNRSVEIPAHLSDKLEVMQGSPQDVITRQSQNGMDHFYIDGGNTIQQFLRAGLIQKLTITRIPVLIGDGIPLFGTLENDIELNHLYTTHFESGFVQSTYEVKSNSGK